MLIVHRDFKGGKKTGKIFDCKGQRDRKEH